MRRTPIFSSRIKHRPQVNRKMQNDNMLQTYWINVESGTLVTATVTTLRRARSSDGTIITG